MIETPKISMNEAKAIYNSGVQMDLIPVENEANSISVIRERLLQN